MRSKTRAAKALNTRAEMARTIERLRGELQAARRAKYVAEEEIAKTFQSVQRLLTLRLCEDLESDTKSLALKIRLPDPSYHPMFLPIDDLAEYVACEIRRFLHTQFPRYSMMPGGDYGKFQGTD